MTKNLSAVKRIQIAARNNSLNKNYKSSIKNIMKKIMKVNTIRATDSIDVFNKKQFLMSQAYSRIDKAVKKGVIHKNTAARKKSRLANVLKSV